MLWWLQVKLDKCSRFVLQIECLCPLKFLYWNPVLGFRRGLAFGRWLGHNGGALKKEISVLIKEVPKTPSPLPPCDDTERRQHLWSKRWALTGQWICRCLDLGIPSFQNCEKYISVVYEPPSLCSIGYSGPNELRQLFAQASGFLVSQISEWHNALALVYVILCNSGCLSARYRGGMETS